MTNLWVIVLCACIPVLVTVYARIITIHKIGHSIFGADAYMHHELVDLIRKNNHRFRYLENPKFLVFSEIDYPTLFHWCFSFISRERLEKIQIYVPVALIATVTFILSACTAAIGLIIHPGHPWLAGGLGACAGMFYGLSPATRGGNWSNLYAYTFTPRAFGILIASLTCFVGVWVSIQPSWWGGLMFGLLMTVACLSSKFSVQSIVLIYGVYSLLVGFGLGILLLLGGFCMAIVLSGGYYFYILKGQLIHLRQYYKISNRAMADAEFRTVFTSLDLFRLPLLLLRGRIYDFFALIKRNVVIRGMMLYPVHLMCGALLILYPQIWLSNPWLNGLAHLWFGSLIVFALISFPILKFIGEADRYLEFVGFFPATIIFAVLLFELPGDGIWACLALAGSFAWYQAFSDYQPNRNLRPTEEEENMLRFFDENVAPDAKIIPVPVYSAAIVIYRCNLAAFVFGNVRYPALYDEIVIRSLVVRLDFEYFVEKYGATHLLIDKSWCESSPDVLEAAEKWPILYDSKQFAIRRLDGMNEGSVKHEETMD